MTVRLQLASVAENAFNAVERFAVYSRLKEEAPAVIENSAPDGWPSAGKVSDVLCCAAAFSHVCYCATATCRLETLSQDGRQSGAACILQPCVTCTCHQQ